MKKIQTIIWLNAICLFIFNNVTAQKMNNYEIKTGLDVIKAYEDFQSFNTQETTLKLITTDKKGKVKKREVKQYTKSVGGGLYNSLIIFESPANERGTSVLINEHEDRDDDQWIYLTSNKKIRRISSADISDNFMRTEITYEDLANQISESFEDYEYELLPEEAVDGFPCYKVAAVATDPDIKKNTKYSKRILWIRKDVFEIIKTTFYDWDNHLFKEYHGTDTRLVAGTNHYRTYNLRVENFDKKHITQMIMSDYSIDSEINDETFSKRTLARNN